MGYTHTFIDQMRHLYKWQGRGTALGNDGYRLNRYHGVTCFSINDQASSYRAQNLDSGFPEPWRNLFHSKARSGTQDQVVVIQNWWEEFSDTVRAAAYDRNLRWAANKPWIRVVTPDQIANGEIDINRDNSGDSWYVIERGSPSLPKVAQDWLDHATQENYDNWYLGQAGREEGLSNRIFNIRPGTPLPANRAFGMQTLADGKLADLSWSAVSGLTGGGSPRFLARATAHTATLLTAFHDQQNNDLSKYSTGAYTNPDTDSNSLSALAARSQSQMRFAAVYAAVQAWSAAPPATAVAAQQDVDLDGENEFILKNDRVFALFETLGGRMTAAWARDPNNGTVRQIVGNFLAYSDRDTEEEGTGNHDGAGGTGARRTSAFKDWYAVGPNAGYVNTLYTVSASGSNGWTFASPDGKITKTVSLETGSPSLHAAYQLGGNATSLYVRFGLSPDLEELLVSGQTTLVSPPAAGGVKSVSTANATATLRCGMSTVVNTAAIDKSPSATVPFAPDTVNMRNQAQVEQVELQGTATAFAFDLDLTAIAADADNDGLPDAWENQYGLSTSDNGSANPNNGPNGDPDGDGLANRTEWLVGLNPALADSRFYPQLKATPQSDGSVVLEFPTIPGRIYQVWRSDSMTSWTPHGAPVNTTGQAANPAYQTSDPAPGGTQQRRFYKLGISAP